MRLYLTTVILAACAIGLLITPALCATGAQPTPQESAALVALKGTIKGTIVWESNRTGVWELYMMNADGSNARQLTHLTTPGNPLAYTGYMRPRFSPDGNMILFAYGTRQAPVEAWVTTREGEDPHKLTTGNPLNWMPDGQSILVLRKKQIWQYNLQTGEEKLASADVLPTAIDTTGMVGCVWPDLSAGVFRFNKNEYVVLKGAKTIKTTAGCEPRLIPGGRYMYWVQGPRKFRVWDIRADEEFQMLGTPPVKPFDYTYFPTVTDDMRYLMFGASPSQHSHDTSDYEIYIQPLTNLRADGAPVRLSFNTGTDRWPYLWVGQSEASDGPYDTASGEAIAPPPEPLKIFSFASETAEPDWGGETGLWPEEVEGCGATTTWVAEDAEGGDGGSMKIDYTITADPRSFSMWFTPGAGTVDLNAHDRFVIWVKGSVPSFTLVIKDATADPEGRTDRGIADCLVEGVGQDWRRFELPFGTFKPREQNGRIDWGKINHVGVAMIGGANEPAGMVQVDNLQAILPE